MKTTYGNTGTQSYIINLTSGVSHANYKYVVSSSNSIKKTVEGAISTRLLPFKDTDIVYSEVEFAHSHIVSVLIPFIKGCMFNLPHLDGTNIVKQLLQAGIYNLFRETAFPHKSDVFSGFLILAGHKSPACEGQIG